MHEMTGEREVVLKLLKETIHHLGQDQPQTRRAALRTLGLTSAARYPAQRDNIVEELQRAHERAQIHKLIKTALAAPTAAPVGAPDGPWYAPRDRTIALFQSAMDEYLEEKAAKEGRAAKKGRAKVVKPKKAPTKAESALTLSTDAAGIEAFFVKHYDKEKARAATAAMAAFLGEQYSNLDPGWVEVLIEKMKLAFKGKAKFIVHKAPTDFRFPLAGQAKIALVGDWGGGNDAAKTVARQIRDRNPDHVIHLGDVYYAGTEKEVRKRFLSLWPSPSGAGRSFALNSNHEMYSGGYAYFNITLKQFKQPASYFSLGNEDVRLIGLDTGYVEHNLNKEQADWLAAQLKAGPAKTILLTHHQLFTAFEGADPTTDPGSGTGAALEKWVKPFLDANKIYAWFWGHEHLCIVYDLFKGTRGRCVGNGCFPYNVPPDPAPYPNVPVKWADRRQQENKEGIHSFALLTVDGPDIHVDYVDQDGVISYKEDL